MSLDLANCSGYPDGTTDHKFTESQKFDYDRLSAFARSNYDDLRWFHNFSHAEAFAASLRVYGFNKYYLSEGRLADGRA